MLTQQLSQAHPALSQERKAEGELASLSLVLQAVVVLLSRHEYLYLRHYFLTNLAAWMGTLELPRRRFPHLHFPQVHAECSLRHRKHHQHAYCISLGALSMTRQHPDPGNFQHKLSCLCRRWLPLYLHDCQDTPASAAVPEEAKTVTRQVGNAVPVIIFHCVGVDWRGWWQDELVRQKKVQAHTQLFLPMLPSSDFLASFR